MSTVDLHLGDCATVMAGMAAGSVDLTVTSPPYDNLRSYNGYKFDFQATARELLRVTRPGGIVVWVVGDETVDGGESGTSFRQALYFMDLGFSLHDTMIYMKNSPSYPSRGKYDQVFEYMFILSVGRATVFNPIKDRVNRWYGEKWAKTRTRRTHDGDLIKSTWTGDLGNKMGNRFNIWQYNVGAGYHGDADKHAHPASFPDDLALDHILSWSNPGDTVLDPMMGSGTTGKMAVKYERNFVGIELSDEYFKIAEKRIAAAQAQLIMPLFGGTP